MPATIPQRILTQRAALRGEKYKGDVAIATLPRLVESLAARDGALAVEFAISRDAQGRDWVRGRIHGNVSLQCQRCLRMFVQPLDVVLTLRLVYNESEEAQALADVEPYLVPEQGLVVREMVEDEVLLALPMVPRCPEGDCTPTLPAAAT